jgi:hypothetical protein
MKTSFAKNVRLVIMKIVVTVAINNLPNYFNYEYSSEKNHYLSTSANDRKKYSLSKKESRF